MEVDFMKILWTLSLLMLGIISYFLRQIHSDFRAFRIEMSKFKTQLAVRDEREKSIKEKLENHEDRIQEVEKIKSLLIK